MSKEGFWYVAYTGHFGSGTAFFALETGRLVGVDMLGGSWDGSYVYEQIGDFFDVDLTVNLVPGGVSAVTGEGSVDGRNEQFRFQLPNNFEEHVVSLDTSLGPVNARLRKIRDWPD